MFQGDFIYIGLVNGLMNIQFYMGGESYLRIELENLYYNDNVWHRVLAQRKEERGITQYQYNASSYHSQYLL